VQADRTLSLKSPNALGNGRQEISYFSGLLVPERPCLQRALANKTDVPIIPVKATQLIGEYVGEGARQIPPAL